MTYPSPAPEPGADPRDAAPHATPSQNAPQQAAEPQDAAPSHDTAPHTTPSQSTAQQAAPQDAGAQDAAPEHNLAPQDTAPQDAGPRATPRPRTRGTRSRWRRWSRRVALALTALVGCLVLLLATGWVALVVEYSGTPSEAAHSTGNDAEWLGHAWVDGRRTQSDVDALAAALRDTGIRDLFVHAGPFENDGTLDPGLRPRARWLIGALHTALPGVRVQAWLGAHPVPGELRLDRQATRSAVLGSLAQVLDDGFDGVHLDFEPVRDGDGDLVSMLDAAHRLTGDRHAVLSLSASLLGLLPGMAGGIALLPGPVAVWSTGYLHRLAERVDQVALMAYDTWLPTAATYGGYVRRATELSLAAVPEGVALLIGLPAYHDPTMRHRTETVAAAVRGVRLALGAHPGPRVFGVSMYVDFAATPADWAAYHDGWMHPSAS